MSEIVLTFQPEGKRVKVEEGRSVLEAAQENGIDIVSICGGAGKCGKCKIIISKYAPVSGISKKERELLSEDEINKGIRLACLTKVFGDITIKVPESSRTGRQRLQIEGIETPIELDPSVKKYYVELNKPTLEDPRADYNRLKDELFSKFNLTDLKINIKLLRNLNNALRENNWKVTVVVWENEIISIEAGNTLDRMFGYAVDIGTTKLAGYLLDLNTGKVLSAGSLMNPQIPYGEDVISRMNYFDRDQLQSAVIEGINKILEELQEKSGIKTEEIYEMTAVGNTVMHHLFFNINPRNIGLSPYTPVIRESMIITANEIGIRIHPFGKIYFLPVIAGYVGADTVSVILATEIYKKKEICMALDIGTNTEVILGNEDRILACACASGPAFEGAQIKFGMRAASGAIEIVNISPDALKIDYQTIDNEIPKGICGSAMVDLLAKMLESSILNVRGAFNKKLKNPRIRVNKEDIFELVIVPKEESGINEDITFSQADVRQIILAKAAMRAGIEILLKKYQLKKDDIQEFYIAGAFGNYIDKQNAMFIGIYPEINLDIVSSVGNAAGTGARMCLVSKHAKKIAEEISKKVIYIELGAEKNFQNTFLNANYLPHADLKRHPEISQKLKELGNFPDKLPHIFPENS
ncbi:MAG: ASKHA domain-containing protein [Candidatus Helarchaeota archaeon]